MNLQDTLEFSKDFVRNVLEKETWFAEMLQSGDCDLLLLTGTQTEGTADQLSDIDIFLICPYESQKRHNLKPVQVYSYANKTIEVSILSTEKLFASKKRKSEIHWWHHCYVIKSYDTEAEKALSLASTLTHEELLDRLWTNFVYFKINTLDIEKQIKRSEPVSVHVMFGENIKLVVDSELASAGEFPSWKQFGRTLQKINNSLYERVVEIQKSCDYVAIQDDNKKLEQYLIQVLHSNGFIKEEIDHWEDCNLERIIFQYQ